MRRTHLLVLLLFALLAVALTYPLVTQLATHVPGSDTWAYDEYTFLWNIWYFKHALIDQLSSPLATDLIFYPVGMGLVMYTFNLMAAGLALPVQLALGGQGIPLSSNLVNLLSSVLGGYGTYLLVRYLLGSNPNLKFRVHYSSFIVHLSAFLAGVIYAFASSRSVYLALGHYMIVTTQWVPFFALYLVRTVDRWRSRDAVLAGLFAALALLTDMLYGVLLGLIAAVILADWWLQRRQARRASRNAAPSDPSLRAVANASGSPAAQAEWAAAKQSLPPADSDPSLRAAAAKQSLPPADSDPSLRAAAAKQSLPPAGPTAPQVLGRLALIAAIAALLSAPLLIPTVREGLNADYAVEGWGHSEKLSADLAGLVTPTDLHPVFGGDWVETMRAVETGASRFSDVHTVFLGWATLALAVLGAIFGGRRSRPWLALALIVGLLALGPLLQINGQSLFDLDGLQVTVPLPYIVLHYLPFIKGFRAPNRFSIVLMQALAVLAGFGAAWLLGKVSRVTKSRSAAEWRYHEVPQRSEVEVSGPNTRSPEAANAYGSPAAPAKWAKRSGEYRKAVVAILGVILIAAVIFEHLAVPMPLTDSRAPAPYAEIARQPGDFALMQLPMGWRNGFGVFGTEDTRVEWYQATHGKPILSGNTSRNPRFKLEYFERLPLLRAIAGLEQYQPPDAATDQAARASAAELMALWNVRYLVVNPPVPKRYPYVDTWQAARDYVLEVVPVDPQPAWDADGVQVYAVQQPPVPFPFELDLGSRDTSAYRGPGWSVDEAEIAGANGIWVDGKEAELFLPLRFDQPQPIELVLRAQPFAYPNAPQQTVAAEFNGVSLGEQSLAPGWQEVRFAVPAEATRSGLNRLRLRLGHAARPIDVLPGQGVIGSTGVQAPLDVEINSGGTAQDIAFITVTDAKGASQDASAGRRGYNLTAIDPRSGAILRNGVRGFDTWANAYEADRLAEFVERLPKGTIVVAAARDDASRFLTDRAVAALRGLGSAVDLRQTPGYGHALIGVKGAEPGTAAELTGKDGAYLRLAADRRALSAAVDWVRLQAAQ